MNTLPTILRSIAAVTSATSAVAAYPVASDMFGAVAGGVIVASSAAVIFAGWHFVGSPLSVDQQDHNGNIKELSKRVGAVLMSVSFASVMVFGIHTSANKPTQSASVKAATEADSLYRQQESSRMNTLNQLTVELRATSKKRNPTEYAKLQSQVKTLSVPTARTKTTPNTAPTDNYSWVSAVIFETVTPALLLLAGMFSGRKPRQQEQPVIAVDTVAPYAANAVQVTDSIELTQLPEASTSTADTVTHKSFVKLSPAQIQQAIAARSVDINTDGEVTVAAIEAHAGCSPRQARSARSKAFDNGYLEKTGSGGSTRYSYPKIAQLRSIK